MGAGHSWPRGIATGRGDFSGETLCSTESAYQRGFSGPTGDRSRRTPHVARGVLTARLSENVVPKRFGVFISTSIIATYIFEVLKTSQRFDCFGAGRFRGCPMARWTWVSVMVRLGFR